MVGKATVAAPRRRTAQAVATGRYVLPHRSSTAARPRPLARVYRRLPIGGSPLAGNHLATTALLAECGVVSALGKRSSPALAHRNRSQQSGESRKKCLCPASPRRPSCGSDSHWTIQSNPPIEWPNDAILGNRGEMPLPGMKETAQHRDVSVAATLQQFIACSNIRSRLSRIRRGGKVSPTSSICHLRTSRWCRRPIFLRRTCPIAPSLNEISQARDRSRSRQPGR